MLHYIDSGKGKIIILVHGMAGSGRYWQNFIPYLAKANRVISIDLLGFGRSPMPKNVVYNYKTHIKSIINTLDNLDIKDPVILVGHSMGGLITLRLAALYPYRVRKLVLIGMPLYDSPEQAHVAITQSSMLKQLAYYGLTSRVLCNIWCRFLRPISTRVAPLYLSQMPKAAAQDSVLHTWQSYAQSLDHVIEHQKAIEDMRLYGRKVDAIYGDQDMPLRLQSLPLNVSTTILPGTHQIIHEQPLEVAKVILGY